MNTPNHTLPRHRRDHLLENYSLRQSIRRKSNSIKSWNKITRKKTTWRKKFYPLHLSSTKCIQECLTTTIRQQRKTGWLALPRHRIDHTAAHRQIKATTMGPRQHDPQALLIEGTRPRWSPALSNCLRASRQLLPSIQRSILIHNPTRTFLLQL